MKCLFSENGDVSMTRVMSLISVIAAIGLAYMQKPGYEYFLFAAFGGKVAQKVVEAKNNKEG